MGTCITVLSPNQVFEQKLRPGDDRAGLRLPSDGAADPDSEPYPGLAGHVPDHRRLLLLLHPPPAEVPALPIAKGHQGQASGAALPALAEIARSANISHLSDHPAAKKKKVTYFTTSCAYSNHHS